MKNDLTEQNAISSQTVVITGAAGNLGGMLAKNMIYDNVFLNLMTHRRDVSDELKNAKNVNVFRVNLADKSTLKEALSQADTVVHFAGVLFHGRPEKFLPETNTIYFRNLLECAIESGVKRVILISFPHVEGETFPDSPAKGVLNGNPISMHAKTRLEEERLLMAQSNIEKVILRVGMVYGRGILMIDAARWFSKYCLLGVWNSPTQIHLISADDFILATKAAIYNPKANGIYHIGDNGVQTLQEFLDVATLHWGTCRPWRMPLWMINCAASVFETFSILTGCKSPLTRDFIRIGRVSYYGDTTRMKAELLPKLKYETYIDGIHIL